MCEGCAEDDYLKALFPQNMSRGFCTDLVLTVSCLVPMFLLDKICGVRKELWKQEEPCQGKRDLPILWDRSWCFKPCILVLPCLKGTVMKTMVQLHPSANFQHLAVKPNQNPIRSGCSIDRGQLSGCLKYAPHSVFSMKCNGSKVNRYLSQEAALSVPS